jgi:hypothetical protein
MLDQSKKYFFRGLGFFSENNFVCNSAAGTAKNCKSSCDEEVRKFEEEKQGLLANVRKMKGELKMAAEREKKMLEKNQALSQKYLDLHLSSKRRDSQVLT